MQALYTYVALRRSDFQLSSNPVQPTDVMPISAPHWMRMSIIYSPTNFSYNISAYDIVSVTLFPYVDGFSVILTEPFAGRLLFLRYLDLLLEMQEENFFAFVAFQFVCVTISYCFQQCSASLFLDTTYKHSLMKQLNRHFNDADSSNKSTILYL